MFRKMMLALSFAGALGVMGFVLPDNAEARRGWRSGGNFGVYYSAPRSYSRSYYWGPSYRTYYRGGYPPRYYAPHYYGYYGGPDYYYYGGRPRGGIYFSF